MQLNFSCTSATYSAIENTLSRARLGRYLGSTDSDRHHALRLYVWNARLCESFYLPTQFCEVAIRNAVHGALRKKFGDNWTQTGAFLCTLPVRLKTQLDSVIRDERAAYGATMTLDHIVSGLSLGFWVHLLTADYEGVFWPRFFRTQFPNKPAHIDRQQTYNMVEKFRRHRNRIAHHKPIFDRQPSAEFQNLLALIKWVCLETHWFSRELAFVQQTINARPQE